MTSSQDSRTEAGVPAYEEVGQVRRGVVAAASVHTDPAGRPLKGLRRVTGFKKSGIVLVTGYAKAPEGTSMHQVFRHAGVVLAIDPVTDTIVDAEFTFVTRLARRFVRDLVVGYELDRGLEPLFKELEERYLAPSQQALMVAIRSAVQRYSERQERLAKKSRRIRASNGE